MRITDKGKINRGHFSIKATLNDDITKTVMVVVEETEEIGWLMRLIADKMEK